VADDRAKMDAWRQSSIDPHHSITVDVDTSQLRSYSDAHLAGLWHLAQLNPAPIEDARAALLVERLTAEIVGRWLKATPPELFHHQPRHPYWWALTQLATWDGERWVPRPAE
jgi:hypothetical protein